MMEDGGKLIEISILTSWIQIFWNFVLLTYGSWDMNQNMRFKKVQRGDPYRFLVQQIFFRVFDLKWWERVRKWNISIIWVISTLPNYIGCQFSFIFVQRWFLIIRHTLDLGVLRWIVLKYSELDFILYFSGN